MANLEHIAKAIGMTKIAEENWVEARPSLVNKALSNGGKTSILGRL